VTYIIFDTLLVINIYNIYKLLGPNTRQLCWIYFIIFKFLRGALVKLSGSKSLMSAARDCSNMMLLLNMWGCNTVILQLFTCLFWQTDYVVEKAIIINVA